MRRKRFEARILATEVGQMLGGSTRPGPRPTAKANGQWVSPDQMLDMMGIAL